MSAEKVTPIESYVSDLEQFVTGNNFWQASLYQQLEGLTLAQAIYKPAADRHCIWELIRHMNYWKYWAITYMNTGEKLNAKGENWRELPEATEENFDNDLNELRSLHKQCVELSNQTAEDLFTSTEERIVFFRQLLYHDCYHTGQIGLLRVMQGLKPAG
jgi:hypothetical protein